MKLYLSTTSPFSRLCLITALRSGRDLDLQFVLPWENPAELLAVNPYSQIPALVLDNGDVLTETLIIMDHLNKAVLAENNPKLSFGLATLQQVVKTFTLQLHGDGEHPHPHIQRANEALARAFKLAPLLEADGDHWGDIVLGNALHYARWRGPGIFEQNLNLANRQALERFVQRDFMVKTTPEALAAKPARVSEL